MNNFASCVQILPRETEPARGGGRAPRARQQLVADPVQREREQGDHLDEEVRGAGYPEGKSRRAKPDAPSSSRLSI